MNRVLALTGAKYSISQAPMGTIARTQLASAVSRTGGFGIIETSSGEANNCQAEITKKGALGAEAIQMGTRFVSCTESQVHVNYKNAIVEAKETGPWVLNTKSTPPIRALKSQRTLAIHDEGLMSFDDLKGIRRVYFEGDREAAPALAGQTVGLIDAVKSAQQIIDDTVTEFFAITARLGALAQARSFG